VVQSSDGGIVALPTQPFVLLAGIVLAVLASDARGRWRSAREKANVSKLRSEIDERKQKIARNRREARRLRISAIGLGLPFMAWLAFLVLIYSGAQF